MMIFSVVFFVPALHSHHPPLPYILKPPDPRHCHIPHGTKWSDEYGRNLSHTSYARPHSMGEIFFLNLKKSIAMAIKYKF